MVHRHHVPHKGEREREGERERGREGEREREGEEGGREGGREGEREMVGGERLEFRLGERQHRLRRIERNGSQQREEMGGGMGEVRSDQSQRGMTSSAHLSAAYVE